MSRKTETVGNDEGATAGLPLYERQHDVEQRNPSIARLSFDIYLLYAGYGGGDRSYMYTYFRFYSENGVHFPRHKLFSVEYLYDHVKPG